MQRLIRQGSVTVNSRCFGIKPSFHLRSGDRIGYSLPPPPAPPQPQEIPLTVVYEDEDLLVVDKPPGLTVHPAPGHPQGTLVNALLARYPHLPGPLLRPGLVHRLDKDTSGLLIVAKNAPAQAFLQEQFKERRLTKRYLVLVRGKVVPEEGAIEAPIARHPRHRQRMAVVASGKAAKTNYRLLNRMGDYSLLEVTPESGRTHQIRVHLKSRGYPVVGDRIYGVKSPLVERQFIHAYYLKFTLPQGGELELTSPLPSDLEQALGLIGHLFPRLPFLLQ